MRSFLIRCSVVLGFVALASCGGGESAVPLIAGQLSGDYEGYIFTPVNGFATPYMSGAIIAVGDGNLHCGTEKDNAPPSGNNAILSVPSLTVGSYPNAFINLYDNRDEFHGKGSNGGSITITAVTATSVVGTVSYDRTIDGKHYAINGSFEVVNCTE